MSPTPRAPDPDHQHDDHGEPARRRARMASIITRLDDGGSERRLYDVLDALDDVEHHVIVGLASSAPMIERLAARHRVTVFPTLVRSVDPARDARTAARLWRELRAGGYDALFTHQSKAGLIGRVVGRAARVPRIYHSASMASFGPGYGQAEDLAFRAAERATARAVDRYFVVGRDLVDRLAANGIPRAKLEVVRSSIDTTPYLAARAEGRAAARGRFGLPLDVPVLCFVGRLDERKGAPRLADLIAAIGHRCGRPVHALVAGQGECADHVRRRVGELGLTDRVHLLGYTDQVPRVLAAADLILLPSSAEGLPQVLAQAAFTGTPFASFDIDGARELLDLGAAGTVAPTGADDVLVAHAAALLRGPSADAPVLAPEVLDQWDPAGVHRRYRAALSSLLR